MLTDNISDCNNLNSVESSVEVKPSETKVEVRKLKGMNSQGQDSARRLSIAIYNKYYSNAVF